MEGIRGKTSYALDRATLLELATGRAGVLVDLGTGDGRFVDHIARTRPDWLVVGIDACRENLRERSRRAPPNALYLIANALALPADLAGIASAVSINFPWGSLLGGLLTGDAGLLAGMRMLAEERPDLDLRLNADALHEQGWEWNTGTEQVTRTLRGAGFVSQQEMAMDTATLRTLPCTWARRLACGRDPRAFWISAVTGQRAEDRKAVAMSADAGEVERFIPQRIQSKQNASRGADPGGTRRVLLDQRGAHGSRGATARVLRRDDDPNDCG